jgi:hypothetical protein
MPNHPQKCLVAVGAGIKGLSRGTGSVDERSLHSGVGHLENSNSSITAKRAAVVIPEQSTKSRTQTERGKPSRVKKRRPRKPRAEPAKLAVARRVTSRAET